MRDIVEVVDEFRGKISHFLVRLPDYELHLKSDNYDVKNAWVEAIRFMKAKFASDCFYEQRGYKEEINDEAMLEIYAELEQQLWESVRVA